MPSQSTLLKTASAMAPLLAPLPAIADEAGRFEVGFRLGTSLASGVPANDMPGYGIQGRYALNDRWSVGLDLYLTEFDYEEPARQVGLPLDPDAEPIDAKAEQTDRQRHRGAIVLTARCAPAMVPGGEARRGGHRRTRRHRPDRDRRHLRNPHRGGPGDHRLRFGGVRQRFGERWFGEFTLSADQHFAAWESEDRVSGAEGRSGDYFAYGFHLGIGYRFE